MKAIENAEDLVNKGNETWFEERIRTAKERREKVPTSDGIMTFGQLVDTKPDDLKYLVDGLVLEAGLTMLYGPPGSFKSNLAIYIAQRGAQGLPIFKFKVPRPFKTLYIDEENRHIGMADKIEKIAKGMATTDAWRTPYVVCDKDFDLTKPEDIQWLKDKIKEYSIDLVIIDSVAKVFPLDERNEKDVKGIPKVLKPIMRDLYCGILLMHHTRKRGENQYERGMEDASGSREFAAMCDSMILLEEAKEPNQYVLKVTKIRYDKVPDVGYVFQVDGDKSKMVLTGVSDEKKYVRAHERAAEALIQWYGESGPKRFTTKQAEEFLAESGFKETTAKTALSSLEKRSLLRHLTYGQWEWY